MYKDFPELQMKRIQLIRYFDKEIGEQCIKNLQCNQIGLYDDIA